MNQQKTDNVTTKTCVHAQDEVLVVALYREWLKNFSSVAWLISFHGGRHATNEKFLADLCEQGDPSGRLNPPVDIGLKIVF